MKRGRKSNERGANAGEKVTTGQKPKDEGIKIPIRINIRSGEGHPLRKEHGEDGPTKRKGNEDKGGVCTTVVAKISQERDSARD